MLESLFEFLSENPYILIIILINLIIWLVSSVTSSKNKRAKHINYEYSYKNRRLIPVEVNPENEKQKYYLNYEHRDFFQAYGNLNDNDKRSIRDYLWKASGNFPAVEFEKTFRVHNPTYFNKDTSGITYFLDREHLCIAFAISKTPLDTTEFFINKMKSLALLEKNYNIEKVKILSETKEKAEV